MRLREQGNEQINSTLTHIYFHIHENFCLSLSLILLHTNHAQLKKISTTRQGVAVIITLSFEKLL